MTDNNKIILISLSQDELQTLIRDTMKEVLTAKNEKQLLSFKETTEFLNISASCLNQWKSQGIIPFKKLGKRIFFSRSEITEALKDAGNYKKLRELE